MYVRVCMCVSRAGVLSEGVAIVGIPGSGALRYIISEGSPAASTVLAHGSMRPNSQPAFASIRMSTLDPPTRVQRSMYLVLI